MEEGYGSHEGIEGLFGVGLLERHQADDAVLQGGIPDGVVPAEGVLRPGEIAGKRGLRRAGVQADVVEDEKIALEFREGGEPVALVVGAVGAVGLELVRQLFSGVAQLVVLVNTLDHLLQTDRDEQTDDDGSDVDEEVSPGMGGFVGRVDV